MLEHPTLQAAFNALSEGLLAPLGFTSDPGSRLFWVFGVSSAVLAVVALYGHWAERRQGSFIGFVSRKLLAPRYWLSRSTLTDIAFMIGNSVIRLLVLVPLVGSHLVATLWVARTLQSSFGNAPPVALPWLGIALLYTLCFFVVEDFSRFSLHRLMHRVPVLWRLHRVHHSARQLTPLTLFRVHPVEMALYYLRGMLVFGGVSGVFVYVFGRQLSGLDVLGVDLLGFAFNFFGANLRHSHVWLSFGPLERWLISPAQHQIHHSRAPCHRDCNFGTCLALWDRLLGSHVPAGFRRQRLSFGVR